MVRFGSCSSKSEGELEGDGLQLVCCFGKWKVKGGWKFQVDCKLRGRMVKVEDETGLKELVKMICEEFDVEEEESIDIAYSLAEHVGGKMPKDTPLVCITKDSQLKVKGIGKWVVASVPV